MTKTKTAAMYGAFIMDGLRDLDYGKVLEKWDQGCIELIDRLSDYTDAIDDALAAEEELFGHKRDHPGVFEYEVINPFGAYCGQHILDHGDLPTDNEMTTWIQDAVANFFALNAPLIETTT